MERGLNPGLGLALLRVVLGVTFVTHGTPKLFGGVGGVAEFLAGLGVPAPTLAAWLLASLESFGGILLILGLLVTPVALLLLVEMAMGILLVHGQAGWYVIGPEARPPGGVEFNVVLIASLLALVFAGPGVASVDRVRTARTPVVEV
ncbi:MAG: DoxX family protein [Gemmatimonadota bacterium]